MVRLSLRADGFFGPRSEHGGPNEQPKRAAETNSLNEQPELVAQGICCSRDRSIHRGAPAVVPVMARAVDVSSLALGGAAVFNAQGGFTLVFEFKGLLCSEL